LRKDGIIEDMRPRLRYHQERGSNRFEMIFSYAIISIMAILGVLILVGAFGISPGYRVTLALILIAYSMVRFLMLKSRFGSLKRKEESPEKLPKEEGENLRKV
jgi:ABC-type transport system involved in Fe-S cluster assembly fused permease/ATPase subunit